MYFAWLGHYTTALIIPAAVGVIYWVRYTTYKKCSFSTPKIENSIKYIVYSSDHDSPLPIKFAYFSTGTSG